MEAPFGVVDMGSNGIRFGIVSALARHLPVAYEERAPISLLEAQGEDRILPTETMDQVITSFLRFKDICKDANVDINNVKVLATEATRVAANSTEFRDRIHKETGWKVTLLSKEEEALTSASGIVGSYYNVRGLTMDLGGGSVELSYVSTHGGATGSELEVCKSPVSLPYGAAALRRRLAKCTSKADIESLHDEIKTKILEAMNNVCPPDHLKSDNGYTVYLSGGGFRALGYLSMASRAQDPLKPSRGPELTYPIPIINGYSINSKELCQLVGRYKNEKPETLMKKLRVFRISKRRTGMIPASSFLVSVIMEVIPIQRVFFSEGGVRQGLCYQYLSREERQKDPLLEGVKDHASRSLNALSNDEYENILRIMKEALPDPYMLDDHPLQLHRLLPAAIHLCNLSSHYPKETRAFVAFHMPLASGPLANVPGISHQERAILSLLLAYRQGGNIPDPTLYRIKGLVGRKGVSVCKYVGRLLELIFTVSPMHPGVGLERSGLKFKSTIDRTEQPQLLDAESSDMDTSDSADEKDDIYPGMKLCIELPHSTSSMVKAPAVLSVIEGLHKQVNKSKFDMDEERRPLNCPTLFSIEVIYRG